MIVRVKEATQMLCGRYNQMCRGEACMQFRRMDSGSVPGAEERGPVGYCGLCGMPTVKVLHVPVVKVQRGMPDENAQHLPPSNVRFMGGFLPASQITPRTRAMERLILQGPDGGKFFEAAEKPGDNGGRPVVVVTPSEDVVLHGSCGECAGEDCPGCVGG